MERIHKALSEGDVANAIVEEILKGNDWVDWRGPGTAGLMQLLDGDTKTLIWVDFNGDDVKDVAVLEALLAEDSILLEEQGKDAVAVDNPLELVVTISADPEAGITNEMRTLYIMFHLWCSAQGLEPGEHDCYKLVQSIPTDRYYKLRGHAFFKILASDRCPICWGPVGPERRRKLPVVCDCGKKFCVNVKEQRCWVEDES